MVNTTGGRGFVKIRNINFPLWPDRTGRLYYKLQYTEFRMKLTVINLAYCRAVK